MLAWGDRNTMTYDGDGKRRLTGGWRKPIWDGENIHLETNLEDATWAVYTQAPRGGVYPERSEWGEVVSRRGGGITHFYHFDALGSADRLTDESQNTAVSYLYRAFGQQTILSGSSANSFTWVGKLGYSWQWQTDDYWLRARVHQPSIGRFLSLDPLRGRSRKRPGAPVLGGMVLEVELAHDLRPPGLPDVVVIQQDGGELAQGDQGVAAAADNQ